MDILRQDLELKKLNFKIDKTLAAQAAFIDKMKSIHGDRYDYSLVDFKLNDKTVTLRCKKHDNIYTQEIRRAYNSYGCIYCQRETKIKLTPRAHKTIVEALALASPDIKTELRHRNDVFTTRIEIVVETTHIPGIGNKLSDRHGTKIS